MIRQPKSLCNRKVEREYAVQFLQTYPQTNLHWSENQRPIVLGLFYIQSYRACDKAVFERDVDILEENPYFPHFIFHNTDLGF